MNGFAASTVIVSVLAAFGAAPAHAAVQPSAVSAPALATTALVAPAMPSKGLVLVGLAGVVFLQGRGRRA